MPVAFAKIFRGKVGFEEGTEERGGITQALWEAFPGSRGSKKEKVRPFEGAVQIAKGNAARGVKVKSSYSRHRYDTSFS